MRKSILSGIGLIVCLAGLAFGGGVQELVSNSAFEAAEGAKLPAGWSVWGPAWEKAACRIQANPGGGLSIDAPNDPYAVGGVFQDIKDIKGGQAYAVKAVCQLRDIPAPYYSLAVRIRWTSKGRSVHPAGMLVRGPIIEGGLAKFDDVLIAPHGRTAA